MASLSKTKQARHNYYMRNRERFRERVVKWRKEHPTYMKEHRLRNPDAYNKQAREWASLPSDEKLSRMMFFTEMVLRGEIKLPKAKDGVIKHGKKKIVELEDTTGVWFKKGDEGT